MDAPSSSRSRLLLRPYQRSDEPGFVALLCDADVMRYVGDGSPLDASAAADLVERGRDVVASDPAFHVWAVEIGGAYAGHAELKRRRGKPDHELVYYLAKPYWGRGYGRQLASELVRLAFETYDLTLVIATVMAANTASRRIVEALGFHEDERIGREYGPIGYLLTAAAYRDRARAGPEERMDAAFWDERYAARPAAPSSEPNPQLAAEAADLPAGVALDVGTGEGDDAIWLAARGWTVTAVDISRVALDRGAAAAQVRHVADRITWLQADLVAWTAPARAFDLVSAQFVHFLPAERELAFARLAAAVRAGGTLLIVGHDVSDLETAAHRWNMPAAFHTAAEVASLLDPREWTVLVAASRPRDAVGPQGDPIVVHDTVLRARRHGALLAARGAGDPDDQSSAPRA